MIQGDSRIISPSPAGNQKTFNTASYYGSRSLSENGRSTKINNLPIQNRAKSFGPEHRVRSDNPCICGPNLFGNVLGPTVDEPILLGLTTFLKMCDECPEKDKEVGIRTPNYNFAGYPSTLLDHGTATAEKSPTAGAYTGNNLLNSVSEARSSQTSDSNRTPSSISEQVWTSSSISNGTQNADKDSYTLEAKKFFGGSDQSTKESSFSSSGKQSISTETSSENSEIFSGSKSVSFSPNTSAELGESDLAGKSVNLSVQPSVIDSDDLSGNSIPMPKCFGTFNPAVSSTPKKTGTYNTNISNNKTVKSSSRNLNDETQTPSEQNEKFIDTVEYSQVPSLKAHPGDQSTHAETYPFSQYEKSALTSNSFLDKNNDSQRNAFSYTQEDQSTHQTGHNTSHIGHNSEPSYHGHSTGHHNPEPSHHETLQNLSNNKPFYHTDSEKTMPATTDHPFSKSYSENKTISNSISNSKPHENKTLNYSTFHSKPEQTMLQPTDQNEAVPHSISSSKTPENKTLFQTTDPFSKSYSQNETASHLIYSSKPAEHKTLNDSTAHSKPEKTMLQTTDQLSKIYSPNETVPHSSSKPPENKTLNYSTVHSEPKNTMLETTDHLTESYRQNETVPQLISSSKPPENKTLNYSTAHSEPDNTMLQATYPFSKNYNETIPHSITTSMPLENKTLNYSTAYSEAEKTILQKTDPFSKSYSQNETVPFLISNSKPPENKNLNYSTAHSELEKTMLQTTDPFSKSYSQKDTDKTKQFLPKLTEQFSQYTNIHTPTPNHEASYSKNMPNSFHHEPSHQSNADKTREQFHEPTHQLTRQYNTSNDHLAPISTANHFTSRNSFIHGHSFHPTLSRQEIRQQSSSNKSYNHQNDALTLNGFTQTSHKSDPEQFLNKVEPSFLEDDDYGSVYTKSGHHLYHASSHHHATCHKGANCKSYQDLSKGHESRYSKHHKLLSKEDSGQYNNLGLHSTHSDPAKRHELSSLRQTSSQLKNNYHGSHRKSSCKCEVQEISCTCCLCHLNQNTRSSPSLHDQTHQQIYHRHSPVHYSEHHKYHKRSHHKKWPHNDYQSEFKTSYNASELPLLEHKQKSYRSGANNFPIYSTHKESHRSSHHSPSNSAHKKLHHDRNDPEHQTSHNQSEHKLVRQHHSPSHLLGQYKSTNKSHQVVSNHLSNHHHNPAHYTSHKELEHPLSLQEKTSHHIQSRYDKDNHTQTPNSHCDCCLCKEIYSKKVAEHRSQNLNHTTANSAGLSQKEFLSSTPHNISSHPAFHNAETSQKTNDLSGISFPTEHNSQNLSRQGFSSSNHPTVYQDAVTTQGTNYVSAVSFPEKNNSERLGNETVNFAGFSHMKINSSTPHHKSPYPDVETSQRSNYLNNASVSHKHNSQNIDHKISNIARFSRREFSSGSPHHGNPNLAANVVGTDQRTNDLSGVSFPNGHPDNDETVNKSLHNGSKDNYPGHHSKSECLTRKYLLDQGMSFAIQNKPTHFSKTSSDPEINYDLNTSQTHNYTKDVSFPNEHNSQYLDHQSPDIAGFSRREFNSSTPHQKSYNLTANDDFESSQKTNYAKNVSFPNSYPNNDETVTAGQQNHFSKNTGLEKQSTLLQNGARSDLLSSYSDGKSYQGNDNLSYRNEEVNFKETINRNLAQENVTDPANIKENNFELDKESSFRNDSSKHTQNISKFKSPSHFNSCRCEACIDAEIKRLTALKRSMANCACVDHKINKKFFQKSIHIGKNKTSELNVCSPGKENHKKGCVCLNSTTNHRFCSASTKELCNKNVCDSPDVRYAITKISKFSKYTTFQLMKSTSKKPRICPEKTEGVFVLKNKTKYI